MNKLFFVGALTVCALSAQAVTFTYTAALNGFQEVPPTNSQGIAMIVLTLDDNTLNATGTGTISNMWGQNLTGFHIHQAPYGVNGPVIVNIGPGAINLGAGTINFNVNLGANFASVKSVLDARNGYFNIHTDLFPSGEIRGQIQPDPIPEPATMAALGLGAAAIIRRRMKKA